MIRFRSGLEKRFNEVAPRGLFKYEPCRVPYTIHREYIPDFVSKCGNIVVECKGFFREGDTQKYKAIRDCLTNTYPSGILVFILSDPNKKVRKGGKMTMGQWCDKEGFEFYTVDTVHKLFERLEGVPK